MCVCEVVRDVFLAFGDLQCVRVCSDVDRAPCTTDPATDGAQTKLIRHWRAGLDSESHCATVATSLEFDWHDSIIDHHDARGVEGALLRRRMAGAAEYISNLLKSVSIVESEPTHVVCILSCRGAAHITFNTDTHHHLRMQ